LSRNLFQALHRRRRGVAIRISSPGGHRRDARPNRREELLRARGPRSVVRHLEEVDGGQAAGQQDRIDLLLDVAGQQEPPGPDLPEEHDRDVVDGRAAIARVLRNLPRIRPQDGQLDVIDRELVPGRQHAVPDGARSE
jgi:hypothetical protein